MLDLDLVGTMEVVTDVMAAVTQAASLFSDSVMPCEEFWIDMKISRNQT